MSRLSPDMHTLLKAEVIELLNSKQIYTVIDFVKADSKLLEKSANLTFREILDVKNNLIKVFSSKPRNGYEYYKYIILNSAIVETGIQNVDLLLEGGLFTGNIYELYGSPAVGKTLFCLTLVKNVIYNIKEIVYYMDTKHDFSARKLKQMLSFINSKEELVEVMNKAVVQRINTKTDLTSGLLKIVEQLQSGFKLRVIIIDSLPAVYMQSSDHTENNSFINQLVNILRYITIEYNIVVVVVNLLTLWNEGNFKTQDAFKEKISCGKYWNKIPNVRLKMEKSIGNKCKFTLTKTIKIMPEVRGCEAEMTEMGIK